MCKNIYIYIVSVLKKGQDIRATIMSEIQNEEWEEGRRLQCRERGREGERGGEWPGYRNFRSAVNSIVLKCYWLNTGSSPHITYLRVACAPDRPQSLFYFVPQEISQPSRIGYGAPQKADQRITGSSSILGGTSFNGSHKLGQHEIKRHHCPASWMVWRQVSWW